ESNLPGILTFEALQVVTATQKICNLAQTGFGFCVMRVTSKSTFLVLRSVNHAEYLFRPAHSGCSSGAGLGGGADASGRGYSHASADGPPRGGSSLLLSAALGVCNGGAQFSFVA